MCHKTVQLGQSKNGFLYRCEDCNVYHLTFGHFYLELDDYEFGNFRKFLHGIDAAYWKERYCNCTLKRKIPIPTLQRNLFIMLSEIELEELKSLLQYESEKYSSLIGVENMDYTMVLN